MTQNDTGSASVYIYRDSNLIPLYTGLTTRGVRRQHEIAESKIWWPLVTSCNIEHFPTREAAAHREYELKILLDPVFNISGGMDKHGLLRQYYGLISDPKQKDSSPAELRRLRLRWRALPEEVRVAALCIRCDTNRGLELLDGSCALCNYLDRSKRLQVRVDGKPWGTNASIKK